MFKRWGNSCHQERTNKAGLADARLMGGRLGVNGTQAVTRKRSRLSVHGGADEPAGGEGITSSASAHVVGVQVPKHHLKIHYWSIWAASMIQVMSERSQGHRAGGGQSFSKDIKATEG